MIDKYIALKELHAILLIVSISGVATGIALLLLPRHKLRERTLLRHWLFEIDFAAILNRYQTIEKPIYRYHRIFGTAVIIGSLAAILPLLWLYDHPFELGLLTNALGYWGTRTAILAGWLLAILALDVGLFLLIRPSALKPLESAANRWIEPFQAVAEITASAAGGFNRLILCTPRIAGLLLLMASVFCLLALARWP